MKQRIITRTQHHWKNEHVIYTKDIYSKSYRLRVARQRASPLVDARYDAVKDITMVGVNARENNGQLVNGSCRQGVPDQSASINLVKLGSLIVLMDVHNDGRLLAKRNHHKCWQLQKCVIDLREYQSKSTPSNPRSTRRWY